ncbi:MAG: repeat-containing protein [Ignavibacteria bacterium]|nr:repeat-containing protein [Ignavibacteria bacterium]
MKKFLILTAVIGLLLSLNAWSQPKYKDMVWLTPTDDIKAFCFSPDSKFIACAEGNYINILDVATGQSIKKLWLSDNHSENIDFTDVKWSNDGRYIIAPNQKNVQVWDAATFDTLNFLVDNATPGKQIGISNDCKYLVASTRTSEIKVWNLQTGKLIAKKRVLPPKDYTNPTIQEMALSPTGDFIVIRGFFEPSTNPKASTILFDSVYKTNNLNMLPISFPGKAYVFSSTGNYLSEFLFKRDNSTIIDTCIRITELKNNKIIKNFSMKIGEYFRFPEFSYDDKYFLTIKRNGFELVVYNIQSWDSVYSYILNNERKFYLLKSSPNGKYIAAKCSDYSLGAIILLKSFWGNTLVNEQNNSNTEILNYYPNPTLSQIDIEYNIGLSGNVLIYISNLNGEKIVTLLDEYISQGKHTITWNIAGVSSGAYFINLIADGKSLSKNIIVIK